MTIENTAKTELTEEELIKVAGGAGVDIPPIGTCDDNLNKLTSDFKIDETPGNGDKLPF